MTVILAVLVVLATLPPVAAVAPQASDPPVATVESIRDWSVGDQELGCDDGMAKVTDTGLALVKRFEGCGLEAYQDAVGVWTIGYGHTGGVRSGMTITQEEAEDLLRADLARFETCVENSLRRPVNPPQFDAMVSLAFNVGCLAFKRSTLLKMVNDGDLDGAANQFGRWVRAGGRVLRGLVRRREAEEALFRGDAS